MFLLSALLLLAQINPLARAEDGRISGVVKTATGAPAANVRVAAAAADPAGAGVVDALVSLTETDEEGRYVLEAVPPGRYYVVAGRVDLPTFYPGTLDARAGTSILVASGARIPSIDFSIKPESAGRGPSIRLANGVGVPISIRVEDGGKVPLFVGPLYPFLRLTDSRGDKREVLFNAVTVPVPPPVPGRDEYRASVEDLPPGYTLKSLTYGSGATAIDLMKNPLKLSAASLAASQVIVLNSQLSMLSNTRTGETLFVVLARDPKIAPNSGGVRVSGTALPSELPIYLSGAMGTVFTDGSFEFTGVVPGRHNLVRFLSSSTASHGIAIVVGDRDVDGVKLQPTTILPIDIERDAPRPAGNHTAGATLPFASIKGRVVEDASREPLEIRGAVTLTGYLNAKRNYALDGEGRFEIPELLSGSYRLQLAVSGYEAEPQTVVIDDGDVEVTFRGRRTP